MSRATVGKLSGCPAAASLRLPVPSAFNVSTIAPRRAATGSRPARAFASQTTIRAPLFSMK
jgi:hypothetical protein